MGPDDEGLIVWIRSLDLTQEGGDEAEERVEYQETIVS